MKMKLFGITNQNRKEVDVSNLEKEINVWLEQHPSIKIIDIKQSSNGGSWANTKVFVSIWYEEVA
ncbi:MAG: hypothetical protein GY796_07900 [Chloroflexi bacterium]|nr:hypothetical protein [Chloroflexota bacterium]